jgi:phosphate transport system permease protein
MSLLSPPEADTEASSASANQAAPGQTPKEPARPLMKAAPRTFKVVKREPPDTASIPVVTRAPWTLKPKFRLGEWVIERGIQSVAFLCLSIIALIFFFVFREAAPIVFGDVPVVEETSHVEAAESYGDDPADASAEPQAEELELLAHASDEKLDVKHIMGTEWQPVSLTPRYGMIPLIVGSLKVTFIALLFAVPIAILAALYTSTFAPKWAKELMKPTIEILAGIPSVVIGFFALVVLASALQSFIGYDSRLNAFVGGLAMAIAVIPIIYTVSEDALAAVPKPLTAASLALGASSWETALFVVLPAATPGIFAAVILGFGRAFGETMIVLMATGNAAMLSPDLFESVRTVSATIGAEMAEVVFGDPHYRMLFMLGTVLFVVSFSLNAIAEYFVRHRLMKKFKGA